MKATMPRQSAGSSTRKAPDPATHEFRILVHDPITDDDANRLFETLPDDPAIETGPKAHAIGFDREGDNLLDLILDAVAQIISAGLEPVAVEDELVTAADIAERTGRTRQSISMLISGDRGPGGFPLPAAGHVRSPLWRWADVAGWMEGLNGRSYHADERSRIVAGVNGALSMRALARERPSDAKRVFKQLVR
jgi:hypothetical protein